MRNRSGEIGKPWGAPTLTGAGVAGAPWKTKVQLRSPRNGETYETRYGGIPPSLRIRASVVLSRFSNPALMSRNKDEIFRCDLCRVLMSLERVRLAS